MEKRRYFTAEQKAKIVMEVIREERTLNEIAAEYEVHPNQLSRWKAEFVSNAARAFSKETDEVEKVKQSYEKEKDMGLNLTALDNQRIERFFRSFK